MRKSSVRQVRVPRSSSRAGITLVEMLVAMTVSLIMIYGLLQAFTQMLSYVNDGRAQVEISGQLRGASLRLQTDLRNPTTPIRAWPTRVSSVGYFEYVEGLGHDADPLLEYNPGVPTQNTSFGDFDDVLMMTVGSRGQPFVGQVIFQDVQGPTPITLDAPYAEVAWWCVWSDVNEVGQPGVDEVSLYRRVLLVRPDVAPQDFAQPPANRRVGLVREFLNYQVPGDLQQLWADLEAFYDNNDISVRPEVTVAQNQVTIRMWANSLADLARRENRFCHRPLLSRDVDPTQTPPDSNYQLVALDDVNLQSAYPHPMIRYAAPPTQVMPSLTTVVQRGDQLGEDVMQSHVLAFDIKVYDPYVPLLPSENGGELLAPHDPGYGMPTQNAPPVIGAGAFVDLFYMNYVETRLAGLPAWPLPPNPLTVYGYRSQNPTANYSPFSGPPAFYDLNGDGLNPYTAPNFTEPMRGVSTPTYDTWSYQYEQDAVNQDWTALAAFYGGVNNIPAALSWRSIPDQGTDGFDNDDANGVDDPNERETAPPYAAPLRGVRISLRVNEPDSRQVRQVSVEQDFTPE